MKSKQAKQTQRKVKPSVSHFDIKCNIKFALDLDMPESWCKICA